MSEQRIGPWMGMANGRKFWPLDPRAEDVDIHDIATSLGNLCRFGGRVDNFYSVAQHSVWVAEYVEREYPDLALHALLHDAAEAYIGDVIRPVKPLLYVVGMRPDEVGEDAYARFAELELGIMRVIHERFGLRNLDFIEIANIKLADDVALATEARDLMGDPRWPELARPDARQIETMTPRAARALFLATFRRLTAAVGARG